MSNAAKPCTTPVVHVRARERPRNHNTAGFSRFRTGRPQEKRLHEAIGYVTPDDEHHGRGPRIRRARAAGMKRARKQRIDYNRNHPPESGP